MTDDEFTEELVARINHIIELDPERANLILCTELMQGGYASVGHFLGQLAMPRGVGPTTAAKDLANVKFVLPLVVDGKIVKFEGIAGADLQKRAQNFKPPVPKDPGEPDLH
jgi:hypothetical protein